MNELKSIAVTAASPAAPLTRGWHHLCIRICRARIRPLVREGSPRPGTPEHDRLLALTAQVTRRSAELWRMRRNDSARGA